MAYLILGLVVVLLIVAISWRLWVRPLIPRREPPRHSSRREA